MKVYFLMLPLLILSCNKNAESSGKTAHTTKDQCFILNEGINLDEAKKPTPLPTHDEILKNLPAHIQMKEVTDYQKFNYDLKTTEQQQSAEKKYFESPEYQKMSVPKWNPHTFLYMVQLYKPVRSH